MGDGWRVGVVRLYKTGVLKELLKSVQSKGYVFQMEIIVRAEKADYRIEEVGLMRREGCERTDESKSECV